MYPEELEKLIGYAIADGTLTDSKRQVLLKKAASLGIDLDEFQLVLDGRLFEKKSTPPPVSLIPPPTTPPVTTSKHGDVKKCPACGAPVPAFSTKCPSCGHEFSNIKANSSIQNLFEMLNQAENERAANTTTTNPIKAIGKVYSDLFNSALHKVDKIDQKKMAIISNFPIPTTKDDILEFLALAVPRAKKASNFLGNFLAKNTGSEIEIHNTFVPAWKAKCGQIIIKAKFVLRDDKPAMEQVLAYAKELGI